MDHKSGTVSYRDLAARAGVSIATVSHVIRGTRNVSDQVRERVERAIAEFNYHPNALARGLRAKSTKTIGLITTEVTNPFYSEIAVAAETELTGSGYTVLIGNILLGDLALKDGKEHDYVNLFLERRVDGLLLTSVHLDSPIGEWLNGQGVPFVLLNRRLRNAVTDYVGVDNRGGMYAATEHLLKLGHRRIGFVGGFGYSSSAQDRLAGYQSALRSYGIKPAEKMIFEGDYDLAGGYAGAKRLLSLPRRQRPTAICAANDLLAFGVMDYALSAGFEIPTELSVTGFDNLDLSRIAPLSLTTVHQPNREMGRAAARLLVQRIETAMPHDPMVIELPCELIVRKTTARPGASRASSIFPHEQSPEMNESSAGKSRV